MRTLLLPFGLAAALACLAPAWAQVAPTAPQTPSQADTLTLDQALDAALQRSPALAAAVKEVEATEGALQQAGLRPNPSLTSSIEDTQRSINRVTSAGLELPLELGGKRAARVDAAQRGREVAQAELANVRAGLTARVVSSYFATLVAQERSKLAVSSAEIATRGADVVGKRVSAGKVSPVEETRARVDEANARIEAEEAASDLQSNRLGLATLLGDIAPRFTLVAGDTASAPSRPALPALLDRLDTAPALAVSRIEIERRRAVLAVERSKAVPDLTVSLGARRDNQLGYTQAVLGVSIPLPIFNRNQGSILEASRRADQAVDQLSDARLQLVAELQQSSNRLGVSRQSLLALQNTVLPSAERAYRAATEGFEAGKFGYLEVLDAQRSLLQARTRYLNTLAAAYQAASVIDRIVGR